MPPKTCVSMLVYILGLLKSVGNFSRLASGSSSDYWGWSPEGSPWRDYRLKIDGQTDLGLKPVWNYETK